MARPEPQAYRGCLRIGACSWKYDSWKGLVYDAARRYRPHDYLADYALQFGTVEIDQWFWSLFPTGVKLPDPDTAREYAEAVPDDFLFTVKAPNSLTLTHYYRQQSPANAEAAGQPNPHFLDPDLLKRFLDTLEPLRGKLGPVMFQFEYLNRQKMPSQAAFLDRLGKFLSAAPAGFQYAVEIRNPNLLGEPFLNLLTELGVGFVYLEGYFMPPVAQVFQRWHPASGRSCVIRLHGGDRKEIEEVTGEQWDRIVDPRPESIQAAAEIVEFNRRREIRTFVNINNHFEGSAPLTIRRLVEVLAKAAGAQG